MRESKGREKVKVVVVVVVVAALWWYFVSAQQRVQRVNGTAFVNASLSV